MKHFLVPDLYELDTAVESAEQKEGFIIANFSKTIFYPGGGGQPHDTGTVEARGFFGSVIEVSKQGSSIMHKIKPEEGSTEKLSPGKAVHLKIDKERRDALVRMHTGEHILFKSLQKQIKGLSLAKIDLSTEESSLYVDAKDLSWEKVFSAEALANEIIAQDRDIDIDYLGKEDAAELEGLRIKIERIGSHKVRVVSIKDFDKSACSGIHAKSTGFVKSIAVTNFSQSHGHYEIRFSAGNIGPFLKMSRTGRLAADLLGTDIASTPKILKKVIDERDEYKSRYRDLVKEMPISLDAEKIGDITFKHGTFIGLDRKKLIDIINEEKKDKTVISLVNKDGEKDTVMLACSDDLALDIPGILGNVLDRFGGRGGGRGRFAQGSAEIKCKDEFFNAIMQKII